MAYLTDTEKRVLFAALGREKKVCEDDKELAGLIPVIKSLEHKFYYDRFEKDIRNKAINDTLDEIQSECYREYDFWASDDKLTLCDSDLEEIAEKLKGARYSSKEENEPENERE